MNNIYIIALCALIFSSQSLAQNDEGVITTDIIEISMNAGYYDFDKDWDLPNASFIGWGLGFQFTKAFRAVLNYSGINSSKSETDGFIAGGEDITLQRYNADLSYSFLTEKNIRPYLALSYGEIDISYTLWGKQKKQDEQLGLGGGVLFKLAPKWFIRSDIRAVKNHRRGHVDVNSMITVAYRFGQGEK
ncbi:MAG: porin family protein [Sinobacterium sp.]|nr:porin family protein [Sinobacterium sp.]